MDQRRSLSVGLGRGLRERCPNCGKGKLFRAYLKPVEECAVCAEPLGTYRADDGPAYFTILIVGHLVVAPLLFFRWIWQAPVLLVLASTLALLIVVTLLLLPRVKGAFIGVLWVQRNRGDEHGPGPELAASEGPR